MQNKMRLPYARGHLALGHLAHLASDIAFFCRPNGAFFQICSHGLDLLLFYVKIFSFIIFLIDAHLATPVVVVVLEMLYMFGAWDLTRASKQPPRAP